jgi:hypothetical protein
MVLDLLALDSYQPGNLGLSDPGTAIGRTMPALYIVGIGVVS